jgi:glycerophosphoryl diester phosphodiesterase
MRRPAFAADARRPARRARRALAAAVALGIAAPAPAAPQAPAAGTLTGRPPVVIAHRGASGYRPEHTLEAYRLAIRQGAGYIEPDLVLTKDGVPIARHEPLFGATAVDGAPLPARNEYTTTNIFDRPEFAGRLRTRTLDGVRITGYWSDDFTLAEVKTLRAVERIPNLRPGNAAYDRRYEIPTLQEVIALAKSEGAAAGRTVGVYPEIKHPTFFAQHAADRTNPARFEDAVVAVLHAHYPNAKDAPAFIQSFEVATLRYLRTRTNLPLVQLLNSADVRPYDFVVAGDPRTYGDLVTPAGLDFVNDYAAGIGAARDLLIPRPGNVLGAPTSVVADAHAAGLFVHAWTFRAENAFLSDGFRVGPGPAARGDYQGEALRYLALGIDGFFTDHPDEGARAVTAAGRERRRRP